jgi:magnesium chelatase subunit D
VTLPLAAETLATPAVRVATTLAAFLVAREHLGGLVLRDTGAACTPLVDALRQRVSADVPMRRVPSSSSEDRWFGGLDLAATIAAARPVADRGVLAESDGGLVVVPSAERLPLPVQARLAGVLDSRLVQVERDGVRAAFDARVQYLLLDEGADDDDTLAPVLTERVALRLDAPLTLDDALLPTATQVQDARERLGEIIVDDEHFVTLGALADAFGVSSMRPLQQSVWLARALAALDASPMVRESDVLLAASLVLVPRATRMPAPPPQDAQEPPPPPPPPTETPSQDGESSEVQTLDDRVVEAVLAQVPPDLLAAMLARAQRRSGESGRTGDEQVNFVRGRQVGARRGRPDGTRRLHVLETLRAAAPWQRVRAREAAASGRVSASRVRVARDDFRVRRFVTHAGTSVIVVVDASGSAAAARLAEAKGAVEQLLAESYARRDRVSLIAFRGTGAETVLPPTRALARARRLLGAMPGGGGTPLAAGIDAGLAAALAARRQGSQVVLVFLTDGRANVARDGLGGRAQASADALDAAGTLKRHAVASVLIDTAPRPDPQARAVADAMGARYVPLPVVQSGAIAGAVSLVRGDR